MNPSPERRVRVAAVADVHSPKYLSEFQSALSQCDRTDLFLLAGDMIAPGMYKEYRNVVKVINSGIGENVPIIACFGNEEPDLVRDEILQLVGNRVTFLDDMSFRLDFDEVTVGIVGAPTLVTNSEVTGDRDLQVMREVFENRAEHLSKLLTDVAKTSTYTILLVHYSPLIETSTGGDSDRFSWWVSKTVERVQPDLVVHGHVHNATNLEITIGQTSIFNVAFPASRKITQFQL
ncbi:MAG: metallophosphoesterase family protein [Candidatus Thorarchaeota archaeon]|jgi:Icc-related predicted phosphoesterase